MPFSYFIFCAFQNFPRRSGRFKRARCTIQESKKRAEGKEPIARFTEKTDRKKPLVVNAAPAEASLGQQFDAMKEEHEELAENYEEIREEYEEVKEKNTEITKENEKIKGENEHLKKVNHDALGEKTALAQKIEKLGSENERLKQELDEYKLRIAKNSSQSLAPSQISSDNDLNSINDSRQSRLHVAIRNSKLEEASRLIKAGINLNQTDQNGRTAIRYAIQHKLRPLVTEILEAGHDVNFTTESGATILDEQMDIEMLDLLLKYKLQPKGKEGLAFFFRSGGSALDQLDLVLLEALLKKGLDPNASRFLHEVAGIKPYSGAHKVDTIEQAVILLMKYGADPHLLNAQRKTALQVAEESYEWWCKTVPSDKTTPEIVSIFKWAESFKPDQECSICLNEIPFRQSKKGPCNIHYFHPNCVDKWLQTSAQCPNCRQEH